MKPRPALRSEASVAADPRIEGYVGLAITALEPGPEGETRFCGVPWGKNAVGSRRAIAPGITRSQISREASPLPPPMLLAAE